MTVRHQYRCASCDGRSVSEIWLVRCPDCGGKVLIHEAGERRKPRESCKRTDCAGCTGCGGRRRDG